VCIKEYVGKQLSLGWEGPMRDEPLPKSIELEDSLLSPEQRQVIEGAAREIQEKPDTYDLSSFWEMDASIGGIGSHCLLSGTTFKRLRFGICRELFRPLQYAAVWIDGNKDIYNGAKWSVLSAGQYLEAATKYTLKEEIPLLLRPLGLESFTLGRSLFVLTKKGILPSNLVRPSELLRDLYNKAKHDANQDEEREWSFAPADALICYVSARIIGNELLKPYYDGLLTEIGLQSIGSHNPDPSG
jgi:hypothetical protein